MQLWTIVARSKVFVAKVLLQVTNVSGYTSDKGFWNNLKLYWIIKSFTNDLVWVLRNCRWIEAIKISYIYFYIIGVRKNSLTISQKLLKFPAKKNFSIVGRSNLQSCSKKTHLQIVVWESMSWDDSNTNISLNDDKLTTP